MRFCFLSRETLVDKNTLESVLDDLNISQYFQAMSFSEEEGVEKPDPVIFSRTLEKLAFQGSGSDVLHIGDSYEE